VELKDRDRRLEKEMEEEIVWLSTVNAWSVRSFIFIVAVGGEPAVLEISWPNTCRFIPINV